MVSSEAFVLGVHWKNNVEVKLLQVLMDGYEYISWFSDT